MRYPKGACLHRMKGHDYKDTWKYHITLLKNPDIAPFGALAEGWRQAVQEHRRDDVKLILSPSGKAVRDALFEWQRIAPRIKILQYAIMPDHLHLLIEVKEYLPENLGKYLARMKVFAGRRLQYRNSPGANLPANQLPTSRSGEPLPAPISSADGAHEDAFVQVFSKGFNDQILWTYRDLDTVFKYVKYNPYRLAVRKANPGFFARRQNLTLFLPVGPDRAIEPVTFQAYGNLQLLANPFKEQVVVHRADSPDIRRRNEARWLHCAFNGGVLVSPFISPAEKAVRAEAEEHNCRMIRLTNEAIGNRDHAHGFEAEKCARGELLLLHPLEIETHTPILRSEALRMNALSEAIAKTAFYSKQH